MYLAIAYGLGAFTTLMVLTPDTAVAWMGEQEREGSGGARKKVDPCEF